MLPYIFRVPKGPWYPSHYFITSLQAVKKEFFHMRSRFSKVILIEQRHESGFIFLFQICLFFLRLMERAQGCSSGLRPDSWAECHIGIHISPMSPLPPPCTSCPGPPPGQSVLTAPRCPTEVSEWAHSSALLFSSCPTPGSDAPCPFGKFNPSRVRLPSCHQCLLFHLLLLACKHFKSMNHVFFSSIPSTQCRVSNTRCAQ